MKIAIVNFVVLFFRMFPFSLELMTSRLRWLDVNRNKKPTTPVATNATGS